MRYTKEYLTEQKTTSPDSTTSSDDESILGWIWKKLMKNPETAGVVAGGAAALTGNLGNLISSGLSPMSGQLKRLNPASYAGGRSSPHAAVERLAGVAGNVIGSVGAAGVNKLKRTPGIFSDRKSGPWSEYPDDPRRRR